MWSYPPVAERLAEKVVPEPNSGCLLWLGVVNHRGYGRIWHDHAPWQTHRIAWVLANGPVPEGKLVLHTCDVRSCVNPAHLYLGTPLDNMNDRRDRGRSPLASQTHCLRGHPYDEKNTYWRKDGQGRNCRACAAIRTKR